MKQILTFIATGMGGAIDVDYMWQAELKDGLWICESFDMDNIAIVAPSAIKRDAVIKDVISRIWSQSNVFVNVKKAASSMVVENSYK